MQRALRQQQTRQQQQQLYYQQQPTDLPQRQYQHAAIIDQVQKSAFFVKVLSSTASGYTGHESYRLRAATAATLQQ